MPSISQVLKRQDELIPTAEACLAIVENGGGSQASGSATHEQTRSRSLTVSMRNVDLRRQSEKASAASLGN